MDLFISIVFAELLVPSFIVIYKRDRVCRFLLSICLAHIKMLAWALTFCVWSMDNISRSIEKSLDNLELENID